MKATLITVFFLLIFTDAALAVRIKDIASFNGARDNQLIGYGLVVGLNGSGDSDQSKFSAQSMANVLERMGITVSRTDITMKNAAAVMVTAVLPPFTKQGSSIDVLVSSMGDSKSLAGGTLLLTSLKGGDGQIYAMAQGGILTNSFSYGGQGASTQKNHPTAGRIPGGALIERELPNVLTSRDTLRLNLHQPDFTTAVRMAEMINRKFQTQIASCNDPGSLILKVPEEYRGRVVEFAASLERLEIQPDNVAKVVLNERTGTIVMGENVKIDTVAVSHGNLTLHVKETPQVSQPSPLSETGETKVVPRTSLNINEGGGGLALVKEGANIGDVVRALNALGVNPRDLIGIMQSIKAAGALQAELVVI